MLYTREQEGDSATDGGVVTIDSKMNVKKSPNKDTSSSIVLKEAEEEPKVTADTSEKKLEGEGSLDPMDGLDDAAKWCFQVG